MDCRFLSARLFVATLSLLVGASAFATQSRSASQTKKLVRFKTCDSQSLRVEIDLNRRSRLRELNYALTLFSHFGPGLEAEPIGLTKKQAVYRVFLPSVDGRGCFDAGCAEARGWTLFQLKLLHLKKVRVTCDVGYADAVVVEPVSPSQEVGEGKEGGIIVPPDDGGFVGSN